MAGTRRGRGIGVIRRALERKGSALGWGLCFPQIIYISLSTRPELPGRNATEMHGNMRDTHEHSFETRTDHVRVVRCQKDREKKNIRTLHLHSLVEKKEKRATQC